MGKKLLSYSDAVKLLGGESRVVAALSKLTGAGLTLLSAGGVDAALHFFELKNEVNDLSQYAVVALRKRLTGLNRFKRSELLEAAHAVLVVSAFFAALDDMDAELSTALNSASLELTAAEQSALATGSHPPSGSAGLANLARELILPGRIPGLKAGMTDQGDDLKLFYANLAQSVISFAAGLAVWEGQDETTRSRWSRAVGHVLPERALIRYEERVGQLAGEFPEFAFWAHRVGVKAVLDDLYAARQTLTGLMALAARGADPGKVRSDLVARYRHQFTRPIAGASAETVSEEVVLPALREIYVNPSYKMLPPIRTAAGSEPVAEAGWEKVARCADLRAMILEHLLSTESTRVPLVLLGQPGAGKSVSTQMLAAELDPRDYLVVRVELRAVPSDAAIQKQIEAALVGLTGREIGWPELAEDAGDAQPVILLDGFDELLQASGLSHFDFLEQVQTFQDRETSLQRPVAVIVTSRTAVANQVRYPEGTVVARLEEFDDDQVGRWLATWNQANPARLLPVKTALAQGELARQPLLLFLLALFHSGGGALTPGISQAQLYQRLFTGFVERDVTKLHAKVSDQRRRHAIQRELDQLSMVAFAMFNRGLQTVTDANLVADLAALQVGQTGSAGPDAKTAALTIADRMAGRFFFRLFIQRDQAIRGQQTTLSKYEFLHASFGEFLVARWIVSELCRLGEQARRAADDIYSKSPDDALLRALLSSVVLSTREQRVLDFMAELLTVIDADELVELRSLTGTLFRGCLMPRSHDPYPHYQPTARTAPAAYAAYSANLFLLLLLIAQAESRGTEDPERAGLSIAELYGSGTSSAASEEEVTGFHTVTRLWHAQLTANEWDSLLDVIRLRLASPPDTSATGNNAQLKIMRWKQRDYQQPLSGRELLQSSELVGVLAYDYQIWPGDPAGRALREANLLGVSGYRNACTALLPYLYVLGSGGKTPTFQLGHPAADMLALLSPTWEMPPEQRADMYAELLGTNLGIRHARLLLERLRTDILRVPPADMRTLGLLALDLAWRNITAYLDIVAHIHAATVPRQGDQLDLLDVIPVFTRHGLANQLRMLGPRQIPGFLEEDTVHQSATRRMPIKLMSLLDLLGDLEDEDSSVRFQVDLGQPIESSRDVPEVRGLIGLGESESMRDLLNLHGMRNLLCPLSLLDLLHLRDWHVFVGISSIRPLLEIALWTNIAQRGLQVQQPPELQDSHLYSHMNDIVPEFVARTRRLATKLGYADPFSCHSAEDGVTTRDNSAKS